MPDIAPIFKYFLVVLDSVIRQEKEPVYTSERKYLIYYLVMIWYHIRKASRKTLKNNRNSVRELFISLKKEISSFLIHTHYKHLENTGELCGDRRHGNHHHRHCWKNSWIGGKLFWVNSTSISFSSVWSGSLRPMDINSSSAVFMIRFWSQVFHLF